MLNALALTSAAQLVGHHPAKQKISGSIPSQGTSLPSDQCFSFTSMFLSRSFSLPSPLSLKINKQNLVLKRLSTLDINIFKMHYAIPGLLETVEHCFTANIDCSAVLQHGGGPGGCGVGVCVCLQAAWSPAAILF